MKWNLFFALFLLIDVVSLSACAGPITYQAEPVEAWVVDAETKQPLEGAVVVAHWVLEEATIVSIKARQAGDLMILETVTDKNGRFQFPAWGPIRHHGKSRLTYMDPELLVFKSNYEYRRLANPLTKEAIEGWPISLRRSVWNGKTIDIKPFKGDLNKYEELFESFNRVLEHLVADKPTECKWKDIPITIRAVYQERSRLISLGVNPNTLSTIDNELLMNDTFYKKGGCGSPKEFFKEFQQ